MQTILVLLIVAAAVFFIFRHFYRSFKKSASGGCGCESSCGCSGCNDTYTCHSFDRYFLDESRRDDT